MIVSLTRSPDNFILRKTGSIFLTPMYYSMKNILFPMYLRRTWNITYSIMIGIGIGRTRSFFFLRAIFVRKRAFIIFFLSTANAWESSITVGLKRRRQRSERPQNTRVFIVVFYSVAVKRDVFCYKIGVRGYKVSVWG